MFNDPSYIIPNNLRKEMPQFANPKVGKKEAYKRKMDPKAKELISKYRKGLIWKDI